MSGTEPGAPPFRYDARLGGEIEARWQRRWEADGTFHSPNPAGPLAEGFGRVKGWPTFYILDMFPYPSGAGLHVGHPLGYIGTDVLARYQRMNGRHVMHALGYDAFGLPAEQYAIDTGQHPQVTTQANVTTMRRQLRRLGLGHDSRREIATTDASFYRWTQWIFLQIFNSWVDERTGKARPIGDLAAEFESGERSVPGGSSWGQLPEPERRAVIDGYRLAYVSEELVNWCPGLGTVLANEEVTPDGRSDIGNYPVYRRPLRQWMLRITAYAERLIADLDDLQWPESIKQLQRNWIGASDGALIDLPVAGTGGAAEAGGAEGAGEAGGAGGAGLVVEVFTTRPDTLAGATYVVLAPEHPLVDQLLPESWPEGTPAAWTYPDGRAAAAAAGAAGGWTPRAAVAAYRAATARLSDRQRTTGAGAKTGVFTGRYVVNPRAGEQIPVFAADYVLMGYGTGAIMAVPAHDQRDLEFAGSFGLDIREVPEPLSIAAAIAWLEQTGTGRGKRAYRLRDWQFSRQRYWGEPFPIVYDEHGRPFALPETLLPVRLPEMTDFRPEPQPDESSPPVPPLARARDWADVELDLGDGPKRYRRELNTMPQWAGSCWYYLRYLDPDNARAFVDPEIERYWMVPADAAFEGDGGVGLYVGGVEHGVLHLLYARFWHKVLYDLGHVSTREPFRRLVNQGYILADAFTDERGMYVQAAEVEHEADGYTFNGQPVNRRAGKMGKSLKNGVSPDFIYTRYGADTLRLYEMATGPLEADRPWRTGDIVGVHRFLQRLWRSIIDETTGALRVSDEDPGTDGDTPTGMDAGTLRRLHQTITVVREDLEALRYNTAIARLIELTTHAAQVASARGALPRALAEPLVLMVAPLAPHIAEELWARLGHPESLAYAPFPVADPALAAEPTVELPVQVNGKVRFTIEVPAGASEDEIRRALTAHGDFGRHTAGANVQRIVVVPGRIANVVTRRG
jgi:leucyl-tRNA synthetase